MGRVKTLSSIQMPADDTVIWRYIDIERFLWLAHHSALFLCRADKFRDPWEAAWPEEVVTKLRTYAATKRLVPFLQQARACNFVSCWHMSSHESAALWDLYARSGFAIRTTVGALRSSIVDEKRVFIGEVDYVDYGEWTGAGGIRGDQNMDLVATIFRKRRSFAHERELRVVYFEMPNEGGYARPDLSPMHHSLRVNLAELVREVYISPMIPEWMVDPLRDLCDKFGVRAEVYRSTLYDPHEY